MKNICQNLRVNIDEVPRLGEQDVDVLHVLVAAAVVRADVAIGVRGGRGVAAAGAGRLCKGRGT